MNKYILALGTKVTTKCQLLQGAWGVRFQHKRQNPTSPYEEEILLLNIYATGILKKKPTRSIKNNKKVEISING